MPAVSLSELEFRAADFVRTLTPGNAATVVTLAGELGAGKTAFVKAAAKALGITDPITSPTFVLMKRYELKGQPFNHLIHIDAYRMKDAAELQAVGWEQLIADKGNLIFLEWPNRVSNALPPNVRRISLAHLADDARSVTIT